MVGRNINEEERFVTTLMLAISAVVFAFVLFDPSTEETLTEEINYSNVPSPNIDGEYHPLQYTQEDLDYMTQALYFEARGEPLECQEMVAHVIMARVYDWYYPDTVEEVIWAYKQFSYTHDGKPERYDDYEARAIAEGVAHQVLSGLSLDTTEGSLYYHNPKLTDWPYKKDYTFVTSCGDHDFYKRKETRKWS